MVERVISFPWLIPTIDEPMSCYTALAFSITAIAGTLIVAVGYKWMKREFEEIHETIAKHDGFVEKTSEDIGSINTSIAVLVEKCGRSQEDTADIKKSIDEIHQILRQMAKG